MSTATVTKFTPVAGVTPGASLRFSRGYVVEGKVHAVAAEQVASGSTVTTVCDRQVQVFSVYSPDAWPRMHAEPHATHETGVCRQCVAKAVPATEHGKGT